MSRFHGNVSVLFKEYLAKNTTVPNLVNVKRLSLNDASREAAVLCCLKNHNDNISVLINIRSHKLSRSPGIVMHRISHISIHYNCIGDACFPGGMVDTDDTSLVQTALRESKEEIHLTSDNVDIVSTLPPVLMGFNEIIKCNTVISTLKNNTQLCLQPNEEVEHVFWVPLKTFLGDHGNHWQVKTRYRDKLSVTLDYFRIQQEFIVWGLTARLCIIAASIIYSRPPAFPFQHYYISSVHNDFISFAKYSL